MTHESRLASQLYQHNSRACFNPYLSRAQYKWGHVHCSRRVQRLPNQQLVLHSEGEQRALHRRWLLPGTHDDKQQIQKARFLTGKKS
jgi:hypothetical protein